MFEAIINVVWAVPGNGWEQAIPVSGNAWEIQALCDSEEKTLPTMRDFLSSHL